MISNDEIHELQSGFSVRITMLPPYHMDFVEEALPLEKHPVIYFRNVAGDDFQLEYKPPKNPPDPSEEEDYTLYMRWHYVEERNVEIMKERVKARRDFLLCNCVHVVAGPYDLDDDDWVMELEGSLDKYGYGIPTHPGAKRLAFIKSKVVTSLEDWEYIKARVVFIEVTFEGIIAAQVGLGLKWNDEPIWDALQQRGSSPLEHNARLWEAETAEACGIPFDERWYSIPIMTRNYMVGAHLGRIWADSLLEEDAVRKATRKR